MELIFISILSSVLTGLAMGSVLFFLLRPKPKKPRKKRGELAAAKNGAVNSVVEHQKIRTAEIEIPVIAEDVLEYGPGELGASYPEATRLFYSGEAISDPDYLETVKRSPLQMQTHEKNTGEFNRAVDGWPTEAWWDEGTKKVMVKGVLHGEENVKYAKENKSMPGFGTSAFISFLQIEKAPGVAPNGKPYDAIVKKAVNNHIAILPGIRDPNNVIVAMNAVEEKTVDVSNPAWVPDESTWERAKNAAAAHNLDEYREIVTDIFNKMGEPHGRNAMPIDKEELRAALNEIEAEKKKEEDLVNTVAAKVKNEMEAGDKKDEPIKSDEKGTENAKNEEGEKKDDDSAASNARPSEEMVKDFSNHLGITFSKPPSLKELASLVGVKAEGPAEMIAALNAKRSELVKPTEAKNSAGASLTDLMNSI